MLSTISVSGQFLDKFIDYKTTNNIILCNHSDDVDLIEEITDSSDQSHLWIEFWDCIAQPIPKTYNSLILLSEIEPNDLRIIFSKENIQRSLTTNTWILYVSEDNRQINQYFNNLKLRLGLNVRLFFVRRSGVAIEATQVLGTGTNQVIYKVCVYTCDYDKLLEIVPMFILGNR